jgi:hypothetical protein
MMYQESCTATTIININNTPFLQKSLAILSSITFSLWLYVSIKFNSWYAYGFRNDMESYIRLLITSNKQTKFTPDCMEKG